MNTIPTQIVVLASVVVGDRLRAVDSAYVELIAASMSETGLRSPIEVRPLPDGRFALIAGAHRLEAARSLGWPEIPAMINDVDDERAELLEVDENLCRHDLNALDRCVFLARRKELYDAIHLTARHGGSRKHWRMFDRSFNDDTAERTGKSARHVRRAVDTVKHLSPLLAKALAGTRLGRRDVDIRLFSTQNAEVQKRLVALLAEPFWRGAKASDVVAKAAGEAGGQNGQLDPVAALFRRFQALGAEEQARFRAMLRSKSQ